MASAFLIVAAGIGVCWPFMDVAGRDALALSGALVLATHLPLHFVLASRRESADRFMAGILLGSVSRILLLVLSIIFVVIPQRVAPAPFLLGLGAFMVAVLFSESIFQHRRDPSAKPARA